LPSKWSEIDASAAGKYLSDMFHRWNFAFNRDAEDLDSPAPRRLTAPFQATNSFLYLLAESLRERGPRAPHSIEAAGWLIQNVPMPKADAEELSRLIGSPV